MGARAIVFSESVQLITETCANCGMIFAMTKDFEERRRSDNGAFYCPRGHNLTYRGESDKEKAARLERELNAALSAKQFAEGRLRDTQERQAKELKRIERRANAGVCQKCHRTFQNVARHMKTKHQC